MESRCGTMDETVAQLGEFGLIDQLTARYPQGEEVLLGPGDDAAVIRAADGRVVATTDLLVEGRHFRRDWSSAYDVGRKAAAQNLADVAAMGAHPTALLVGLAAPPDLPVDWALGLAEGLRDECRRVGASVAGGDVVRGDAVTIAVTALGDLRGRPAVTRAGARPGDLVAVCGRLGYSAAGLAVLEHGLPETEYGAYVAAHRRPDPPYAAGPAAAGLGATALIDVSDGLLQDLGHVAHASGVAIVLDRAALAVPDAMARLAAECATDPLEWVLTGGEDHAMAATFPAGTALPADWRVIGRVAAGEGVTVDGRPWAGSGGWNHFA
ncbi:Thiamine-monophosphate kinase [Carbonactinospora thermoautotrophica]|uniref:Thiamine-monophosphate kinase n=4 Tax=Carbonactinospora thermoautotrophica TaxID=1469144 RepID=A0A132MP57_9ACTN|nr:Thiamine-monophosphate kinase [Carbonactinospora thermoautotrophica]